MPSKTLLVLANSFKHVPSRCVAGREVLDEGDEYSLDGWVRPVSNHGEGELSFRERSVGNREVRIFDFVTIPLAKPVNDPTQPENWLIRKAANWIVGALRRGGIRIRP
ncbi:MAG: dual OB domain-containing protein [Planctomycetota bacterium]